MNESIEMPLDSTGTQVKKVLVIWGILLLVSLVFVYALSFLLPTLAELAVEKDPTSNNTEGFKALAQGDMERAEALFRDSLQQVPDQDLPHFGLAMILRNKGELQESLEHANEAIGRDPEDIRFRLTKADILADMQRYDESLQSASDALKYESESDEIYSKLGHIYMKARRMESAEEAFYKALALNPDSAVAERGLALAYVGQGEREKAIPSWKRLVARFPSDPEYHFQVGVSLLETGKIEEGLRELNAARKLAPDEYEDRVQLQLKIRDLESVKIDN